MTKTIYTIDGTKFSTLQGFAEHLSSILLENYRWDGNLDAFNDLLRGGFGTPTDGFIIQWKHSALSREHLGYAETIKWLEECIEHCHPTNIPHLRESLAQAKAQRALTLFDMLIEIIHVHCPGGEEEGDGVELLLL